MRIVDFHNHYYPPAYLTTPGTHVEAPALATRFACNGAGQDGARFWPIHETANLDAVLYIHPSTPIGVEDMTDFRLAGSGYPHLIGSIPRKLETIRELWLPERDEAAICDRNAARLLRL